MDKKILDIDESTYEGDADMLRIVQRLVAAASDAKIRHDMNVEDEFFSVIEKRDTDIMLKDKKIAEQSNQIAEQWSTICTSVKMLHGAGMSAESIAMNLNLDLEKVRQMIKE
jgi:hypothetical protein